MNNKNIISQQIERGINILRSLNDLEEIEVDKYGLPHIKFCEGQKSYDEKKLGELETKVQNWMTESETCLSTLGITLDNDNPFQMQSYITRMIDKRKALIDEIQMGIHCLSSLLDITDYQEFSHFPLNNNTNEGIRLFNALTDNGFMQGALDSWLFLMGFSNQKPLHVNVTKWLGTKEQLQVMLRLLFERLIKENALSVADIERITPNCFIDKNGKPMRLAKPKKEISKKMDKLTEIFRPHSDF